MSAVGDLEFKTQRASSCCSGTGGHGAGVLRRVSPLAFPMCSRTRVEGPAHGVFGDERPDIFSARLLAEPVLWKFLQLSQP